MRPLPIRRIFCVAILLLGATFFAEQTEQERRRDIFRYGLEPEITELIASLQSEKSVEYDADILALFGRTRTPALKETIIAFFASGKNDSLKQYSLDLLADPYDARSTTVNAVLGYVAELKISDAAPHIRKILASDNSEYRDRAITTLGRIGTADDAQYLIEYLDGDLPGDEKQRLIIRQNVMDALGELRAIETWEKLSEIAQNPDENVMIRASAARAVGKMGKPEAIPVLSKLYEETDPVLRTASINALGNFSSPEATALILESFRDSYYKVRVEAIAASESRNLSEAVPYILYRAKSDPVEAVKVRAFEALGKLNDSSGNDWLAAILADDKIPDKMRVKAASVLLGQSFDAYYKRVEEVMLKTLKDDKKTWIRYELGKLVAGVQNQSSFPVANAFISHKDTLTRSLALDMYEKNRYPEMMAAVEAIAADEKQGALQRRAKKILGK